MKTLSSAWVTILVPKYCSQSAREEAVGVIAERTNGHLLTNSAREGHDTRTQRCRHVGRWCTTIGRWCAAMKPMQVESSSPVRGEREAPPGGAPAHWVVVAALLMVQLVFSGWHVVGKAVLEQHVDPVVFALYRELSAALFIFGVAVWKDGGAHAWLPRREHCLELGAIGFLTFVAVVGFIVALGWVSPFNAAVLQPTIPVFTTALAVCLRMEEPRASYAVGVGLSVCGALLVAWGTEHAKRPPPPPPPPPPAWSPDAGAGAGAGTGAGAGAGAGGSGGHELLGNLILLFQCFCSSLVVLLQKRVVRHYRATWITCWYYSVGADFTALLALLRGWTGWWGGGGGGGAAGLAGALSLPGPRAAPALWAALAYAALFATTFNYIAITWANTWAPASEVAAYSTVQPLATAVLAFVVLGSPVTAAQAAGGVLVVAGLWVVTLLAAPSKAASFRAGAVERHMGSAWSTGPDDNLSDSEDDSWLT